MKKVQVAPAEAVLVGNPTIGADIEVFLQDKKSREIVSAEGFIKGTKNKPFVFDKSDKHFAISLDNVLAEFCIPPVRHVDEWVKNIMHSLNYINETIPERLCTVAQPAAILNMKYLMTENAMLFGCEPDYNVWKREVNNPPEAPNKQLRSGGGHIHIGYENPNQRVNEMLVKTMDLMIGVPSVIQEPDNERKLLYGKAGAFRFKEYGVEYRTVSNYYLQNENLMRWAFNNTMAAIEFLNKGKFEELEAVGELVQAAINGADKTIAANLIRQFEIEMA